MKDDRLKYFNVMKQVFEQMQGSLRLQRIGRSLHDPLKEKEIELLGINIWPGHQAQLCLRDAGMMLQVNSIHAVIRTNESVLGKIRVVKEINEARGREFTKEIHDLIVG